MPKEKLEITLKELREELSKQESSASRTNLERLVGDIEGSLATKTDTGHFNAFVKDIEKQIVEIEAAHPDISRMLARVIDCLNSMGI